MRCINVMLLLLSVSFVASIPINHFDENRSTIEEEMIPIAKGVEEEVVVFPKNNLPIEEVILVTKKPEESKETFTGPPQKGRKLLNFLDDEEDIENEDFFGDEEENFDGFPESNYNSHNLFLRPGASPAPIPPNSPAGKAMAAIKPAPTFAAPAKTEWNAPPIVTGTAGPGKVQMRVKGGIRPVTAWVPATNKKGLVEEDEYEEEGIRHGSRRLLRSRPAPAHRPAPAPRHAPAPKPAPVQAPKPAPVPVQAKSNNVKTKQDSFTSNQIKQAEDAKKKAEAEAKKKAEDAKRKAEAEAKKKAEDAKKKAEAEAKKKADEAKKKAEAEAKKKADKAKKKAEAEAKKKADEAKRKADAEAKKKADEAKKNAEKNIKILAELEAKKKVEEARKKLEAETKKKIEEAKKKIEEDAKKKEKEAKKKAEKEAKKKEKEAKKKLESTSKSTSVIVLTDTIVHCVDHFLALKYDGAGNVFIAGAEPNGKVHSSRGDCRGFGQGWKKVITFNTKDVDSVRVKSFGTGNGKTCGGNVDTLVGKSFEKVFTDCAWSISGAQFPEIKTSVDLNMKSSPKIMPGQGGKGINPELKKQEEDKKKKIELENKLKLDAELKKKAEEAKKKLEEELKKKNSNDLKEFPIKMTVDNEFDLFINGKNIGSGNTWTTTYSFTPKFAEVKVISVAARNTGGPAAIIGNFAGKVTKASEWRCKDFTNSPVPANWMNVDFDDSTWEVATSYGKNKDTNVWMQVGKKARPGIPGDAEWIWSNNNENHHKVYCRSKLDLVPTTVYVPYDVDVNQQESQLKPSLQEEILPSPFDEPQPQPQPVPVAKPQPVPFIEPQPVPVAQPQPQPQPQLVPVVESKPQQLPVQQAQPVVDSKTNEQETIPLLRPLKFVDDKKIQKPDLSINDSSSSSSQKQTQSIVRELSSNKHISIQKITVISKKIHSMLDETKNREIIELTNALNNVNSKGSEVNKIYGEYNRQLEVIKVLKVKIDHLKIVVKKHFDQMQQDSEYLKSLDLIKPKYFKTLEKYSRQLLNVNATIAKHIVEGEDKKNMFRIIAEANEHTLNSTGRLSKAFLEHYEKYKNVLNKDKLEYEQNVKELEKESSLYNTEETTKTKYYNNYQKAINMLNNLKNDYVLSEKEAREFDNVIEIVKLVFKNPNKIKSFFDGPVDGQCATTLLKTHIKNDLL